MIYLASYRFDYKNSNKHYSIIQRKYSLYREIYCCLHMEQICEFLKTEYILLLNFEVNNFAILMPNFDINLLKTSPVQISEEFNWEFKDNKFIHQWHKDIAEIPLIDGET